jgi:hypothetical protein
MLAASCRRVATQERSAHVCAARAHPANGAYHQLQLDVYGKLMDSVYLCNK